MEIEGIPVHNPDFLFDPIEEGENNDICSLILSKYSNSSTIDHHSHHLCAVVGAMAQELKDQNIPLSPIAYFGATVSSLERLSSDPSSSPLSIDALLTLLSIIIPKVSAPILRKDHRRYLELVVRVLQNGPRGSEAKVGGIKCIGYLLGIGVFGVWSDISQFYAFLLGFFTDLDHLVRRESHLCIRDALQSFQGSPFLVPASQGITDLFKKLLLLDGASSGAVVDEGAAASRGAPSKKDAQELLHVVEALKDCLPCMPMKYKTIILKNYKSLLGMRQPLVTRLVTDCLNVLCHHRTVEISAEVLVDLLGSLAFSVTSEENSADALTFTARLLDAGLRKVHSLNRETCVNKLPLVFNTLQDIFGSGFEEAKYAAAEAMKNLIQTCVDEDLIKEGVNRIKSISYCNSKNSSPSIIEKICATVGSLLDNRYSSQWGMAFQVVSFMFDKLGEFSSILMKRTLECLANIERESDEDFPERKQLYECLGSSLQAMGPEVFLSILPLNLRADNLSEMNDWLFLILKQYTIGARLKFYVESLLDSVAYLKQKSHKLNLEGHVQSSRVVDSFVHRVWSILPSFCNYPSDTAESFNILKKALCNTLSEESDLHGIICFSLQVLIQQNKCILEGSSYVPSERLSICTEKAIAYYTHDVASANLAVLKSSAHKFLSVLSEVFLKSKSDPGGSLQSTISEFASIADKGVVAKSFTKTMGKLLKVTQEAAKAKDANNSMQIDYSSNADSVSCVRAQLFDLAVSLLPGLSFEEIKLLYVALGPALKDSDGLVQKKAYKVLSRILKNSDGWNSRELEKPHKLLIEVLPLCHFSAKRHRLDCLYYLIVHVAKDEAVQEKGEIISSFLTEIILALKEANKKTRNRAYDILVQIGHACGDEESGGKKGILLQFFNMVAGHLVGGDPHMISAAARGLARLAYEFSDLIVTAYDILPSSFLLLQRKNREIIKANLGLVKVLVAKSPAENLHSRLKYMVEGILKWQDDTKNHFKAKVKNLLAMLVKKCGYDAIKAVMPEEHMKLLTNIRKIKERRERKLGDNSETRSHLSKATTSRRSEWGHTKVFSDFDEDASDDDYMDAEADTGKWNMSSSKLKSKASSLRSKKIGRPGKFQSKDSLHQLGDGEEPLDLLDQRKTRAALHSGLRKRKLDSDDDEPEFDDEGRLIVREGGKRRAEKKESFDSEFDDEDKSEVVSHVSTKSKKGQKRRKTSDSGWAYTGSEYTSKKARGDLKKKGKLEPYAYWPLDRKMLSRRPEHKAAARRGMVSVVKLKKFEGKSVANALSMSKKKRRTK